MYISEKHKSKHNRQKIGEMLKIMTGKFWSIIDSSLVGGAMHACTRTQLEESHSMLLLINMLHCQRKSWATHKGQIKVKSMTHVLYTLQLAKRCISGHMYTCTSTHANTHTRTRTHTHACFRFSSLLHSS